MRTKNMWDMIIAVVIGLTVCVSGALAADVTLTPSDDSYVDENVPTSNFGSDAAMLIKNYSPYVRRAYIAFDLSSLTGQVASAQLSVAAYAVPGGDGSTTLVEYLTDGSDESWSETNITWNSQPVAAAISLGSFTWGSADPDGTWYNYSGQNLASAINADKNGTITFLLRDQYTDNEMLQLSSKEDADSHPKLEITYVGADPAALTASRDSFVEEAAPTNNNGTETFLKTKLQSSFTREAYVAFDLSPLTRKVVSATFSVAAQGAQSGGGSIHMQYLTDGAGESWNETNITWNNTPAAADVAIGWVNWSDSDPDGTWYSISGQSLIDAINGDSNDDITFHIESSSSSQLLMSSREDATNYPKLEFTYVASNTAALFASRDSYVDANDPDGTFGDAAYMLVKNASPYVRHAYISFDLSSLPSPAPVGWLIDSATLFVQADGVQVTGSDTIVKYLANGDNENWVESTISWNTKPSASAITLGTFTWHDGDPDGTWYSYSSKNLVDALNADTNGEITFVFEENADDTMLRLATKEGDKYGPRLEITYVAPQGTVIIIQ